MFAPRAARALYALLLAATPAAAADKSGQWITPPATFLVSNYVKSTRAPAQSHDIVLDVPQGASAKTKPTVARSCGDSALDEVAIRFVQLVVGKNKKVQAMADGKSLRFQIRLLAGSLDPKSLPKHLQRPDERVYSKSAKVDFPPIPRLALQSLNAVDPEPVLLRLRFPAAGGMPDEAVVMRSSGQVKADAAILLYSLANARGKPSDRPYFATIPAGFSRSLEPSDIYLPPNFPSNYRTF